MKKLLMIFVLLVPCVGSAQTIYTSRTTYGTTINAQALTTDGWTGWLYTDNRRTVCFNISIVDADASCTSIDMTCEGVNSVSPVLPAQGTGFVVPVYTSTAATGITQSTTMTIRQTATGGGAPGTSKWSWCTTNIATAYIACLFHANGVPTALIDTITVNSQGITP